MNLSIEGASILFDDCPKKLWGIRLANGTRDDTTTKEQICLLDEYRSYGVNTITTFFMGCRESAYDPFSPDGRHSDADIRRLRERDHQCGERAQLERLGKAWVLSLPGSRRDHSPM